MAAISTIPAPHRVWAHLAHLILGWRVVAYQDVVAVTDVPRVYYSVTLQQLIRVPAGTMGGIAWAPLSCACDLKMLEQGLHGELRDRYNLLLAEPNRDPVALVSMDPDLRRELLPRLLKRSG